MTRPVLYRVITNKDLEIDENVTHETVNFVDNSSNAIEADSQHRNPIFSPYKALAWGR